MLSRQFPADEIRDSYPVKAAQLFLKRLRKGLPPKSLRYLYVVEPHKSGEPHLHVLIHEQVQGTVTKRKLERAWGYGFTKFRLADEAIECTKYCLKYVTKAGPASPVRASQLYGRPLAHVARGAT